MGFPGSFDNHARPGLDSFSLSLLHLILVHSRITAELDESDKRWQITAINNHTVFDTISFLIHSRITAEMDESDWRWQIIAINDDTVFDTISDDCNPYIKVRRSIYICLFMISHWSLDRCQTRFLLFPKRESNQFDVKKKI